MTRGATRTAEWAGPAVRLGPPAFSWPLSSHALAGCEGTLLAVGERVDRIAVEETLHAALAPRDDRGIVSAREHAIAETIAQAVDLRFDEHLTLGEFAGIAGISVFHACRAFRRVRKTSIHRYRQTVRLRHALALLRDTSWPLARVAIDAGFANQGHLGNVFRRRLAGSTHRKLAGNEWLTEVV